MKTYHIEIKPLYRKLNKHAYEYEGWVIATDHATQKRATHAHTIQPLRRQVAALMTLDMRRAQALERTPVAPKLVVPALRPPTPGMTGHRHSEETKAKMRERMLQRHAAGDFKAVKLGRPTDKERAVRLALAAAAAGMTQKAYKAHLALVRIIRDSERARLAALYAPQEEPRERRALAPAEGPKLRPDGVK